MQQSIGFQQFPAERQQCTAPPVCEESAEANAHKTTRQYVEQEPPEKFLGGDSHQPLFALMGIIFPAEGDPVIGKIDDPVVGDSDAMRVAGQVMEDMLGSSEWPFGVNYPVVTKQWP
jgi:hypothetical protein